MTETEQKKEYLKKYIKAKKEIARIDEKLNELRINKIYPSINSDGMPHAKNINDLSGYAAIIDELEREQQSLRFEKIKLFKEITEKIERLNDETEKNVLTYRYIRDLKWEIISEKIEKSIMQTHRIHGNALKNFKI